jgi:hypothetical protein
LVLNAKEAPNTKHQIEIAVAVEIGCGRREEGLLTGQRECGFTKSGEVSTAVPGVDAENVAGDRGGIQVAIVVEVARYQKTICARRGKRTRSQEGPAPSFT